MKTPVRIRAMQRARGYIGVGEDPPGSNSGRRVRAWLREAGIHQPAPWCAAFVYSQLHWAGSKAIHKVKNPAAVLSWVDTADRYGWRRKRPFRGDLVAYDWHGPTPHPDDHLGFIERVLALPRVRPGGLSWLYWIRTVEGNTGDAVRRRWRWVAPDEVAFIRIPD